MEKSTCDIIDKSYGCHHYITFAGLVRELTYLIEQDDVGRPKCMFESLMSVFKYIISIGVSEWVTYIILRAWWLSGRFGALRPEGLRFESHSSTVSML